MAMSEYQAGLESIKRRRAIADAMQSQSMQQLTAPLSGTGNYPIQTKIAPIQVIGQLAQAWAAKKQGRKLDKEYADIAKAMGSERQKALDALTIPQDMGPATSSDEGPTHAPISSGPTPEQMQNALDAGVDKSVVASAIPKTSNGLSNDELNLRRLAIEQTSRRNDILQAENDARANRPSPAAPMPKAGGFDDPRIQELQAAFVGAGYSPPAGFRAKEQQLSMYHGLLKKYEGLSPDDIAHLAATNSIDFKSVGKATQAAASMGGRVEVANNELRGFVPIAKDASAAVDRGTFVPFNRLKQKGQAAISDPNLKRLFVATQTVLNAYDVLAARGGTDKDKRAENHRILENADSPETYNAALDMIVREGVAAGAATRDAMRAGAFGYPSGQPAEKQVAPAATAPPLKNAKGWVLHTDAQGNKAYVGPNNEVEEVQ